MTDSLGRQKNLQDLVITDSLGPSNDKGIPRGEWHLAHKLAKQTDDIVKRNQAFDAMTPAERRVTIARDVLKWLGAGKLEAKSGVYFALSTGGDWGSFPEVNGYSCKACAVGGAAACVVERLGIHKFKDMDAVDIRDVGTQWREFLSPYFEDSQLALMETAFEQDTAHGLNRVQSYSLLTHARRFGMNYANDNERMVAIYENIIANGGTFVP